MPGSMLQSLRAALGFVADPSCEDCELKCASASVTPHKVHVLVRLPRDPGVTGLSWWPETLGDRLAAFEAILDKKRSKQRHLSTWTVDRSSTRRLCSAALVSTIWWPRATTTS